MWIKKKNLSTENISNSAINQHYFLKAMHNLKHTVMVEVNTNIQVIFLLKKTPLQ